MLEFSQVRIGEGEPVACLRCHPRAAAPEYLPAGRIADEIARVAGGRGDGPGPNVELTGPDPLHHPELPTVVASALAAGVRRLRLDTDAAAFAVGGNAAGAVAAGVLHVRFTVLGGTPGVHDVLAGAPGALDATTAGVRAYADAARAQGRPVHVSALVPLCRHTARDLPAAVGAACEAGADEVLLRVDDGGMDLVSAVPWVSSACATGVVNGVWVQVDGVPFCMLEGDWLHVADVVRARDGEHGAPCEKCALRDVCSGGPAGASAETLAALAPPARAEGLAARVRRAREGMAT